MPTSRRRLLLAVPALAAVVTVLAACGEHGIQLAGSNPNFRGAQIFVNHCSGCHTLGVAGTQGSATNVRTREYKDGPNFNVRKETLNCILYAIRNGGFSGGPMPQDIVTGQEAEQVARFVAAYSGRDVTRPASPQGNAPINCPAG